jgi:hypothetical protein
LGGLFVSRLSFRVWAARPAKVPGTILDRAD